MLSTLIPDILFYILGFLPPYYIAILRHVNLRLAQQLKALAANKRIPTYYNQSFYADFIVDKQPQTLIDWARRRKFPWPDDIYTLIKNTKAWHALAMLREDMRLNPNLVEEVVLYITTVHDSNYLYTARPTKWWQYKEHRWFPMDESPLDVLYENARRYYTGICLTGASREVLVVWRKLLTKLCTVPFRILVNKMATDWMRYVPAGSDKLDAKYICCTNGILDTETRQLRNGIPEDYVFCGTDTEYVESHMQTKLHKSFETSTGRSFLSFCGDALKGKRTRAIFVVQAANYERLLSALKTIFGDYAEFYNPSKAPYLLKKMWTRLCVIETDKRSITPNALCSMFNCGMNNAIILCSDVKTVDPVLFTPMTILMRTDAKEFDETVLLARMIHSQAFEFPHDLSEQSHTVIKV